MESDAPSSEAAVLRALFFGSSFLLCAQIRYYFSNLTRGPFLAPYLDYPCWGEGFGNRCVVPAVPADIGQISVAETLAKCLHPPVLPRTIERLVLDRSEAEFAVTI